MSLLAILGWIGLKISWFPIRVGETNVATKIGLWQLALDLVSEEEASLVMARYLSVPIMFPTVRKMRVQGRATSVTFPCGRTVWRGLKLSCTTSTSTVMIGIMGLMTAWMIGLMNNLCVEIMLWMEAIQKAIQV